MHIRSSTRTQTTTTCTSTLPNSNTQRKICYNEELLSRWFFSYSKRAMNLKCVIQQMCGSCYDQWSNRNNRSNAGSYSKLVIIFQKRFIDVLTTIHWTELLQLILRIQENADPKGGDDVIGNVELKNFREYLMTSSMTLIAFIDLAFNLALLLALNARCRLGKYIAFFSGLFYYYYTLFPLSWTVVDHTKPFVYQILWLSLKVCCIEKWRSLVIFFVNK